MIWWDPIIITIIWNLATYPLLPLRKLQVHLVSIAFFRTEQEEEEGSVFVNKIMWSHEARNDNSTLLALDKESEIMVSGH